MVSNTSAERHYYKGATGLSHIIANLSSGHSCCWSSDSDLANQSKEKIATRRRGKPTTGELLDRLQEINPTYCPFRSYGPRQHMHMNS
uniref:Uncharacterized protein n=1 Tax=Oryza nivara TaxID=4536 RepID=A0A0E0G8Y2_ORYNI